MLALKLILEGLGLGFLLYLVCAIGIWNEKGREMGHGQYIMENSKGYAEELLNFLSLR